MRPVTRSHFDAQLYCDLGTPGQQGGGTGWLTRAWNSDPGAADNTPMPMLAVNSRQPANMLGGTDALSMGTPTDFALNAGPWQWREGGGGRAAGVLGVNDLLAEYLAGRSAVERQAALAEQSLRMVRAQPYSAALPAGWPTSTFARQLWTVAQSIRFGVGLRYAAVDLGGWDTHEGQGTAGSGYHYYQNKIAELSQALTAFYVEMAAGGEASRVTVVVQSEFGRRVRQNGSGGTDHGYGNPMLVLGGPVNGRRFYGQWMGLDPEVLSPYFGDIRSPKTPSVLSELLIRRMGNTASGRCFPPTRLCAARLFQGNDMPPEYGTPPPRARACGPGAPPPAPTANRSRAACAPPRTRVGTAWHAASVPCVARRYAPGCACSERSPAWRPDTRHPRRPPPTAGARTKKVAPRPSSRLRAFARPLLLRKSLALAKARRREAKGPPGQRAANKQTFLATGTFLLRR